MIDLLTPLPEAERAVRIERECAGRPALRDEIRSLLNHTPAATRFLRHLQGHVPGPLTGPGADWSEADDEFPPGARIGRYRVVERIGSGAMGTVYRAHDDALNRDVALKLVPRHLSAIPGVRDRFLVEARAAAALDHPNVCTIHEIGETEDGRPFLAMPAYGGDTLKARLDLGPVAPEEAVDIATALVRGLAAAHARGIVHRDIKPGNLMLLPDGTVKILDFGIAQVADARRIEGSTSPGTVAYMSPEQARGDEVDGRADLWAAGVVLYEMLAGHRPFQGEDDREILEAIVTGSAAVLPQSPAVTPELAAVVDRLLKKPREDRYASADELLSDLERVPVGALPAAGIASDGRPRRLPAGRRGVAAAGALLVISALAVWSILSGGAASHPEPGDPAVVAVLPFGVSGAEPPLRYLSEGMLDLLAVRLGDSPGLRAVDPGAVIQAVRRAGIDEGRMQPARARALAAEVGAGRLVTGEVVNVGDQVALSAALQPWTDGEPPHRVAVEGPVDSLPALVDRLAVLLISLLSGEAERLASITTSSLPALQDYLDGRALYRRGQYDDAAHRFASAVELDSTFAMAALMTWRAGIMARPGVLSGRDYIGLTVRYRDRLGTGDRLYLDALVGPAYPNRSTPAALHAARQRLVAARPDDPEAWFRLAEGMPHELPRTGVDPFVALERTGDAFRRSLELDPSFLPAVTQLQLVESSLGDTAAAFRLARHYLSRVPDGLVAETMRCTMVGATAGFDSLDPVLDEFGVAALGRCLHDLHHLHPAASTTRDRLAAYLERRSNEPEVLVRAMPLMYAAALDRGRPGEAARYARIYLQTGHGSRLTDATTAVREALHWEGQQDAAERGAAYLEGWWADGPDALDTPLRRQVESVCALGQWRIARGRPESAAPLVRALRDLGNDGQSGVHVSALHCGALLDAWSAFVMGRTDLDDRRVALEHMLAEGSSWPRLLRETGLVLAQIGEARGDLRGARDALDRSFFVAAQYYTSSYRRVQGRLATAAGDTAEALDAYRRYLAMRSDPEPALRPEVERVRQELQQLSR